LACLYLVAGHQRERQRGCRACRGWASALSIRTTGADRHGTTCLGRYKASEAPAAPGNAAGRTCRDTWTGDGVRLCTRRILRRMLRRFSSRPVSRGTGVDEQAARSCDAGEWNAATPRVDADAIEARAPGQHVLVYTLAPACRRDQTGESAARGAFGLGM